MGEMLCGEMLCHETAMLQGKTLMADIAGGDIHHETALLQMQNVAGGDIALYFGSIVGGEVAMRHFTMRHCTMRHCTMRQKHCGDVSQHLEMATSQEEMLQHETSQERQCSKRGCTGRW